MRRLHCKSGKTKIIKVFLKVLRFVLMIFIAMIIVIFIYLLTISKGQIQPFLNETGSIVPGSIAEKTTVEINGSQQGMMIRGKSSNNPVLLFVHGGPGVPEYFLNEYYRTDLEKYFTVCWWENRGSGLSYHSDLNANELTIEQAIDDTISVSNYLRDRFGKDKIYLMGHSFGTFIAIQAAAKHPELYAAYIAMAQYVSDGTTANTLTYNYMTKILTEQNDYASLRDLNTYVETRIMKSNDKVYQFKKNFLSQIDDLKHKTGCGTMHNMSSVITGIFLPQITSKCYTFSEKINYWQGKSFLRSSRIYEEFINGDLTADSLSFHIPIYFFSGIYDYTCPYPLTLEYYKTLNAPVKGFYTFRNSAHSPLWEEPDRTIEILVKDVLQEKTTLAD